MTGPPTEYAELVLDIVERIPPGRVMSYGMIAEILRERTGRGSARTVGTVMARYGGGVPWHRVVNGAGRLPPGHEETARRRLADEGVPFRGAHVDLDAARWWPES
jgi:alkylated DNA nucleotide flippase Atl1